jgi:hypothetical protein
VVFQLDRWQDPSVGPDLGQQHTIVEDAVLSVGEGCIEPLGVVLVHSLVVNGRRDQRIAHFERERALDGLLVGGIRVGRDHGAVTGARNRVDAIHKAAVTAVPDAEAVTEFILNDRAADRDAILITQPAAFGLGQFCARQTAELGQAGLVGDETHRAGLRAGSEQRALRAALDLDAIQVEDDRIDVALIRRA